MTTQPFTPPQQKVLDELKKRQHGAKASAIGIAVRLSQHRTTEILRELRKLGAAAPTSDGNGAVWATPFRAAAIREANAAAKTAEQVKRDRQAYEDKRRAVRRAAEAAEKAREDAEAVAFARPSIRRVLAPGEYAPLDVKAPNSIFNCGLLPA